MEILLDRDGVLLDRDGVCWQFGWKENEKGLLVISLMVSF